VITKYNIKYGEVPYVSKYRVVQHRNKKLDAKVPSRKTATAVDVECIIHSSLFFEAILN